MGYSFSSLGLHSSAQGKPLSRALFGPGATLYKKLAFSFFISFTYCTYKSLRFLRTHHLQYLVYIILLKSTRQSHVRFSFRKPDDLMFTVLGYRCKCSRKIHQPRIFLYFKAFCPSVSSQKTWGSCSHLMDCSRLNIVITVSR